MVKLTKTRLSVLSRVDEDAQSFRIARTLGMARTSVSSALQHLRHSGLVDYQSRWRITPAGRAALEGQR